MCGTSTNVGTEGSRMIRTIVINKYGVLRMVEDVEPRWAKVLVQISTSDDSCLAVRLSAKPPAIEFDQYCICHVRRVWESES